MGEDNITPSKQSAIKQNNTITTTIFHWLENQTPALPSPKLLLLSIMAQANVTSSHRHNNRHLQQKRGEPPAELQNMERTVCIALAYPESYGSPSDRSIIYLGLVEINPTTEYFLERDTEPSWITRAYALPIEHHR